MTSSKSKVPLSPLRWLLLLAIPAMWCVLSDAGSLAPLENRLLDLRFHERGEIDAPVKIVYVNIDARSLDELGAWPWTRAHFARVASALVKQGHARAVGIDMVLSDRERTDASRLRKLVDGNVELAKYLSTDPPVVLAASYAAVPFLDFGVQRPTLIELPMVILRTVGRAFASRTAEPLARRNSHDVPLLGRNPAPGIQFEPPEVSSLNLGRKELWTPARVGLTDTVDERTRWVPAFIPTVTRNYHTLAIEVALAYWQLKPDAVKVFDDRLEIVRPDGSLVETIPLQQHQLVEVNWFSAWGSPSRNPRLGFATVLDQAEQLDSGRRAERAKAEAFFAQPIFKDAIVLIGPVDPLLHDLATTPFDDEPVPKVSVHGNLLKTIFSGQFLRRLTPWQEYLLVFGLTLIVSRLAIGGGAYATRAKLAAALLVTAFVWLCFWAFRNSNLVLPMGVTLCSVFSTTFAAIAWQLIREEQQKRDIKGMFGSYVSPQLVQRMVDSGEKPRLGGHKQDLTAFFSDIESFSKMSEQLDSGRLVELMNEYLTACTEIIEEETGQVDKYIGDAVMAMFGAPVPQPDHAYRACLASQRIHLRMIQLRLKWRAEGERWPEPVWRLQTRIGLNSGLATVGNLGSHSRLNYTVMGDNVNLAARMETGARHFGVRTMVTEATKTGCEQFGGDHVVFRFLDRIVVKGRTGWVPVYEIVGLKDTVTAEVRAGLAWFDRGLQHYFAQDWDAAAECFAHSSPLEVNQPDVTVGIYTNPSLVFLARCAEMKQRPPGPGWDGTYQMPEK